MEIGISSISELRSGQGSDISKFILENLNPNDARMQRDAYVRLMCFLDRFNDDLTIIAETDYIDKTYRDLYYHFYSTKLRSFEKNCVRLSFCNSLVDDTITHTENDIKKLKDNYLGFVVLRPLGQSCIGRNVISPKALKSAGGNLLLCKTSVDSTVLGNKVSVCGFPHSSQDGEMMTCAETTIWAIMSYLANRYNIYSLPLGHNILASLTDSSYERQTPSRGLNFQQISLSLQNQGLACRVYDKDNPKFKEILSCYIESGIPLALCIESRNFGHAVACIGRKAIDRNAVTLQSVVVNGHTYFEWNKCIDEFVVNDDNATCYQVMNYTDPCSYYGHSDWSGMEITHFVAPLHQKIYLDAEIAIEAALNLVNLYGYDDDSVIRTFLTSSRSYREYIMSNNCFSEIQKQAFVELDMPKFIWVTEISNETSFKASQVNDIILMDATSGQQDIMYNAIIFKTKDGIIDIYDKQSHDFKTLTFKFSQNFHSFYNIR